MEERLLLLPIQQHRYRHHASTAAMNASGVVLPEAVLHETTATVATMPQDTRQMEDLMRHIFDIYRRKEMSSCQEYQASESLSCEEKPLYQALMGPGFLTIFILALAGNAVNLAIYNSTQIRFYLAIRMLCTKLLMNTLIMLVSLPTALRLVGGWQIGGGADRVYWHLWPFFTYATNLFGFCAMWLTVLMTCECCVHVLWPTRSKQLCTRRNVSRAHFAIAVLGALLALHYPLNRRIRWQTTPCGPRPLIDASDSRFLLRLDQVQSAVQLLLAIVVPLLLLTTMTAAIVWRLMIRSSGLAQAHRHFSTEKQSVTRITLITTLLQVGSDLPAVPVFCASLLLGPQVVSSSRTLCAWHTVAHFLGFTNLSLSFFVYFAFSPRFRALLATKLRDVGSTASTSKNRHQRLPSAAAAVAATAAVTGATTSVAGTTTPATLTVLANNHTDEVIAPTACLTGNHMTASNRPHVECRCCGVGGGGEEGRSNYDDDDGGEEDSDGQTCMEVTLHDSLLLGTEEESADTECL